MAELVLHQRHDVAETAPFLPLLVWLIVRPVTGVRFRCRDNRLLLSVVVRVSEFIREHRRVILARIVAFPKLRNNRLLLF